MAHLPWEFKNDDYKNCKDCSYSEWFDPNYASDTFVDCLKQLDTRLGLCTYKGADYPITSEDTSRDTDCEVDDAA